MDDKYLNDVGIRIAASMVFVSDEEVDCSERTDVIINEIYERGKAAGAAAQLEACEKAVKDEAVMYQAPCEPCLTLKKAIAALRASAIGGGK